MASPDCPKGVGPGVSLHWSANPKRKRESEREENEENEKKLTQKGSSGADRKLVLKVVPGHIAINIQTDAVGIYERPVRYGSGISDCVF